MKAILQLNAVAFQEDGVWIVQGVDYDIATFTHDVNDVPEAFMKAVMEYVCITVQLGREPLQGVKSAPSHFKDMFDAAKSKVSPVHDQVIANHMLPKPAIDIRLAAA